MKWSEFLLHVLPEKWWAGGEEYFIFLSWLFCQLGSTTATGPWILEIIYNASEEGETTHASVPSKYHNTADIHYSHRPKTRLIKTIQSLEDSQVGLWNSWSKFSKVWMLKSW